MRRRIGILALFPAFLLLVGVVACEKGSPVAPSGTILTISADPTRTSADGTSTITVVARKPNGTPVSAGTQIRMTTTLGRIQELIETDDQGIARTLLQGDGRRGVATVTARLFTSGEGTSVTVEVVLGEVPGSITLQASPSSVPVTGGIVELLALVRDSLGQLLAGAGVNFQTEIGTLRSGGGVLFTDARGEVRDVLTVTEADLSSITAPTFQVRAQVGGSGGNLVQATFQIRIQSSAPIASFLARSAGGFKVFFENTTQGAEPISYQWDFTNDGTIDSTVKSPTHDYGNAGTFTVRLVASNSAGTDTEIQTVTVPVP